MGFSSCSDFLDKMPSNGLPVDEAITSVWDLGNAVNGIGYLMSEDRMTYSADFAIISDLRGSDFQVMSRNNQAAPIAKYNITKYDEIPYYGYIYFYKAIARVNHVLSLVDDISYTEKEEGDFNTYKAQLYAWRAMLHFDLARMFCNAPTASKDVNAANSGIVLSTAVYSSDYVGVRSTLKETYDQVLDDFQKSLSLFPEKSGVKKNDGKFNIWAVKALRARVYLYNGNYELALADAVDVIENSPYSLYSMAEYPTVWANRFTNESIFELAITTLYNAQRNSVGYYCDPDGYAECAFLTGEGTLVDYLLKHTEDVRSQLVSDRTDHEDYPGYYPAKYPGRDKQIYVNNPKLIRLSEVYLIAAEAALKVGATPGPEFYINKLRENRIEDYKNVASVTLEDILFERRLELFAENSGAWDAWRNKLSVKNLYVKDPINYDDYRTIFPIPQDEVDIAPTKLIQNPGY